MIKSRMIRPKMVEPRVTISTTFDVETAEQLREAAFRAGLSQSGYARHLIVEALRERETGAMPSQAVTASDAPQEV